MRKSTLTLLLGCALASPAMADVTPLDGFFYGSMPAPTGWEWQSPDSLGYNKEQPHAWFFSFGDVESARKAVSESIYKDTMLAYDIDDVVKTKLMGILEYGKHLNALSGDSPETKSE